MNRVQEQIFRLNQCKQQNYIKQDDATFCVLCLKKFIFLYRKKYRCQSCGKIFCKEYFYLRSCSSFFINVNNVQKRLCETCNEKFKLSKGSLCQQNIARFLSDQYQQMQQLQIQLLNTRVQQKIHQLVRHSLCDFSKDFVEEIYNLVLNIKKVLKPNSLSTGNLNILKMIKIKGIKSIGNGIRLELIKGLVIKKSRLSKKMCNSLVNPTFIYLPSLDPHLDFQNLIDNQQKYYHQILSKLLSLKVQLVLVQSNINKILVDMLTSKGITAVGKVRANRFKYMGVYGWDSIGSCEAIQFYQQKENNRKDNLQSYCVFQTAKTDLLSLLLYYKQPKKLKQIKCSLKSIQTLPEILKIGRHLLLQKQKLHFDRKLWMSIEDKERNVMKQAYFKFIDEEHQNLFQYMKVEYFDCYKMIFAQLDIKEYPNITSNGQLKYYKQLMSNMPHFTFQTETHGLCSIYQQRCYFYSEQDTPFGHFLIDKFYRIDHICKQCQKPLFKHKEIWYSKGVQVVIQVGYGLRQKENQQQCKEEIESGSFVGMVRYFKDKMEKGQIKCFIRCNDCLQQLSHAKKLKRSYIQYSFFCYLYHFYLNDYQTQKCSQPCKHNSKSRVYQFDGKQVRIYVQNSQEYQMIGMQKIQEKEDDIVNYRVDHYRNALKDMLEEVAEETKTEYCLENHHSENAISHKSTFIGKRINLPLQQILPPLHELLQSKPPTSLFAFHTLLNLFVDCYQILMAIKSNQKYLHQANYSYDQSMIWNLMQENEDMDLPVSNITSFEDVKIVQRWQSKKTCQMFVQLMKSIPNVFGGKSFVSYLAGNTNNFQSLISCALNSLPHYNSLLFPSSQQFVLVLLQPLTLNSFLYIKHLLSIDLLKEILNIKHPKRNFNGQVRIYYPQLFQRLRREKGIRLQQLISQMQRGVNLIQNRGGKKGKFYRTQHQYYLIKEINQKQLGFFKKIHKQYFCHVLKGSLLIPILGIYEITINGRKIIFSLMQNLAFNLKNTLIYDLKGSQVRRFSIPPKLPLDTNYLIDRNSHPLPLSKKIQHFQQTLAFFNNFQIIDYSLILIIQPKLQNNSKQVRNGKCRIGIIDYLRQWGMGQKIQEIIKGVGCTVTCPEQYSQRFAKAIRSYFIHCI